MLTPQEVSEHAFAKASFRGYDMDMVDEFLDLLTSDYTALYNENAVLKSKMKVLVDKVDEYRATEEAMRKALMTAQRMADDLVQEAEEKKAAILREAEKEAGDKIAQIRQEAVNEEYRLTAAQNATTAYVVKLKKLHQQELEYLDSLAELCPPPPEPVKTDKVEQAAQQIEDNIQRIIAAEVAAVQEQPEPEESEQTEQPEPARELGDTAEFTVPGQEASAEESEEEAEDPERTRVHRIDFGKLQFGRDYEIK